MKIINVITILAVIAVNALANILPINGVNTGEVSALYDNYFTPAGFTFGIWSIIYLGLLVYAIYQLFSSSFKPETIGYLFVWNGFANMGWMIAWHHSYFFVTLLFMGVLLYTLVHINLRINDSTMLVKLPFQIYLGWICVATVANMAVYLTYIEWPALGISEVYWGMLLVMIAGAIGLVLLIKMKWMAAGLAIAWGIWGIYSKQVVMNRADAYQLVCLLVIGILLLGAFAFQVFLYKRNKAAQLP